MEIRMNRSTTVQLLIITTLLLLVTAVIAAAGWDMQLARQFYVPGSGFPTGNLQPWHALYLYGLWPAYLMAGVALLVFTGSFIRPRLMKYRTAALFLVLLLLVGPGLLANAVFKDHWGRPRPVQVEQFGGNMAFHQTWQPGPAPKNASFPAGHPTAAFYLSAPFFVLRRTRPRQAYCWLWGGFAYGVIMGMARIIQGGHFLSDVLWSAGFVYLTALVLAALLHLDAEPKMTTRE
jgi:lipid A 4'-phosphatase